MSSRQLKDKLKKKRTKITYSSSAIVGSSELDEVSVLVTDVMNKMPSPGLPEGRLPEPLKSSNSAPKSSMTDVEVKASFPSLGFDENSSSPKL
jgi:hypothetical protein